SKRQTSEEVAKRLPVSVLEEFYHVPLNIAARELSVSLTMLKKLCRQYGIKRWPHRQVSSLNKSLGKLEEKILGASDDKAAAALRAKAGPLRTKRELIIKTASAGLDPDVLNAVFAARP
ncbi:RWP-RK domain-containing protein, partial [Tribonema minus]